jgi:multiple sugar transport system substrate-binding protein
MRPIIPWLPLLSTAAIVLLGCNQGLTQNQSDAKGSGKDGDKLGEKVQLVISRWAGPHADDQAAMLGEFEKATGIRVRMDAIDYGQLRQKQMLNMGGKTGAYDLVFAQEVWIPEYVSSGYLRALNDYVNDPALSGKDFDFADFEQSLIQSDTVDSKLYGIPTFVQTPLVVFNKEVFGTMGVQTPKTWDDTLSIATKLSQQGTGIALPAKEGLAAVDIWFALARSNNGGYFDAAGRLNLVTPENIATCTFWKDLVAVSMRGSTNWHFDDVNKAVQFGQAAFGITISGLAGQLEDPKESRVAGKIGYAPLPYKQRPFGTLSVWSWCVTADSKHPKEAFRLAAWLTSKQIEKAMSLKNGQVCARKSVLGDLNLVKKAPYLPAITEALENADTQPRDKNAPKLMDAMQAALSRIATNGSEPKQELESVQQQLAADFK